MSAVLDDLITRRPKANQRQLCTLLEALERGERLTVGEALNRYGCYALSQRMGELRAMGWPIRDQWHPSGACKVYFL